MRTRCDGAKVSQRGRNVAQRSPWGSRNLGSLQCAEACDNHFAVREIRDILVSSPERSNLKLLPLVPHTVRPIATYQQCSRVLALRVMKPVG